MMTQRAKEEALCVLNSGVFPLQSSSGADIVLVVNLIAYSSLKDMNWDNRQGTKNNW